MRWGMFWEIAIVSKAYHGDINGEDVSPWFLMRSLFFHWNNEYHVDHRIRSPFSMNIFRQDLIRLLQRVRSWTWGSLEARTGAEVAQRLFVFMISCCGRPWFVSIYIYTHILYIYIITYTWFLVCMYIYIYCCLRPPLVFGQHVLSCCACRSKLCQYCMVRAWGWISSVGWFKPAKLIIVLE
jgi:hypothetical protein